MVDPKEVLVGLRDIRGVEGSFLLLAPGGELVARDGLQVMSEASFGETARRLSNVFATVGTVSPEADELVLRFDGMALFTRRSARVMLGVLANESASLPALRMGSNLVLRQLESAELTPAPPAETPREAKGKPMMWRGSPISGKS